MRTHTFVVNKEVRFTRRAQITAFLKTDGKRHTVTEVQIVPDVYEVPPEYAGFGGIIGHYAGVRKRALVGHHQWVTLENGMKYSGVWLMPAMTA